MNNRNTQKTISFRKLKKDLKDLNEMMRSDLKEKSDFPDFIRKLEKTKEFTFYDGLFLSTVYALDYSIMKAEMMLLNSYIKSLLDLTEKLAKELKVEIQVPVQFQKEVNEFVRERENAKKRMREYVN